MAYYTIAHHLHGSIDNLSGTASSSTGIKPEDLTDDVFNYIFLAKPFPESASPSTIPQSLLQSMRDEFEYWYPFDLRVSAKDLIPNHLTMSLYNHVEIWKDRPQMWPRGISKLLFSNYCSLVVSQLYYCFLPIYLQVSTATGTSWWMLRRCPSQKATS